MKTFFKLIKISAIATAFFMFVLCVVYPLVVYAVGQFFFHESAQGSLLRDKQGTLIGSKLIGQNFQAPHYFHPRPSSAGKTGYDASNSSGSNLGPTSQKLIDSIQAGVERYREENQIDAATSIPVDAVTGSASGLDPHISVKNAFLQMGRVAKARNISEATVRHVIEEQIERPWFSLLGEARINVLLLNLKLDEYKEE